MRWSWADPAPHWGAATPPPSRRGSPKVRSARTWSGDARFSGLPRGCAEPGRAGLCLPTNRVPPLRSPVAWAAVPSSLVPSPPASSSAASLERSRGAPGLRAVERSSRPRLVPSPPNASRQGEARGRTEQRAWLPCPNNDPLPSPPYPTPPHPNARPAPRAPPVLLHCWPFASDARDPPRGTSEGPPYL